MKTCSDCQITKSLTEYFKSGTYNKVQCYRSECKLCVRKRYIDTGLRKEWQKKRRDTDEFRTKRRAKRKLDRTSDYKWEMKRYKNDILFRFKKALRSRLNYALRAKKWNKNSKFKEYLGCEVTFLQQHLENQFTDNMSWDNYGHGPDKWTIDHIIPLSNAKTLEEMIKLCHYTNLQPMWFLDNIKKSNKI